MSVLDKINELKEISTISKHEQLVGGIINAIDAGILTKGDQLPSINKMVAEMKYARKTIVKAYEELKSRGIVESKNFKGYFIASEETNQKLKVALLLFAFHSFQESLYNSFRNNLDDNIQLDIFFHHNNIDIFEAIMNNISQKYGMYIIAPIPDRKVINQLKSIPSEKLLIIDRHVDLGDEYSYISQEFENNTYNILKELLPDLKRFDELVLFFEKNSDFPPQTLKGFKRFVQEHNISSSVKSTYIEGTVKKGKVYMFINDSPLWTLLRDCKKEGLSVGTDVGIIAHNDNLVKEMVVDGITTISTDFKLMGKKAANYVNNRTPIQEIIPTRLIKRNSL